MNDQFSIVFNPGRVYFDFRTSMMQDLVDDWDGELFSSKKLLYFVEDDFRLQISHSGQIKAFGIQQYKDSYSIKHLLEWSVPKALEIFKQNDSLFTIDQINIIWSSLPEGNIVSEQQQVCNYIKQVLGSNIKLNTLSLDEGNHVTIITGASLSYAGYENGKTESMQRSVCQ